jgi:hypothetical protein
VRLRVTLASVTFEWETEALQFRLGRGDQCALRFEGRDAAFLSWEHADFATTAEGLCYITDLYSSNGTYVNGSRITGPTPLHVGSTIQIGRTGPRLEVLHSLAVTANSKPNPEFVRGSPSSVESPVKVARPFRTGTSTELDDDSGSGPAQTKKRTKLSWPFQIVCWILGAIAGLGLGYYILTILRPDQYKLGFLLAVPFSTAA